MSKTPAERHVDVPAAPLPAVLEELLRRPAKNSQELSGVTPDIHGRAANRVPGIEAAPGSPVVDIATIGPHRRRL